MNRRMLDGGVWANEHFASLPPMARLLQIGIINLADDQGRMKSHPAYLRSQIFPYDDVSIDDIRQWLELIMANGMIVVYEAEGKDYLQLVNWWTYQSLSFAAPSEYPRPDGWQDRIRYTGKNRTIYTCNWITSAGDLMPDTCDQMGNPLPKGNGGSGGSHGQPCAEPYDQPCAALTKDKDKDQLKREIAGAPACASQETPSAATETDPPPSLQTGPDPVPAKAAVVGSGGFATFDNPGGSVTTRRPVLDDSLSGKIAGVGMGWPEFTVLTNAVLDVFGVRAVVDAGSGDQFLARAQECALGIAALGFKSADDPARIMADWMLNDYRGQKGSRPNSVQFVEHAAGMAHSAPMAAKPAPRMIRTPAAARVAAGF